MGGGERGVEGADLGERGFTIARRGEREISGSISIKLAPGL